MLQHEQIYKWVAAKEHKKPVYHMFEVMDDLMSAGKFQEASDQLKALDLNKLDTYSLVSVLVVSTWGNAAKDLPDQQEIVAAAKKRIEEIDPERAKKLTENF